MFSNEIYYPYLYFDYGQLAQVCQKCNTLEPAGRRNSACMMQRQLRASKQLSNTDNRCSLSHQVKTSKWYLRRIDTDTDTEMCITGVFYLF